MSQLCYFAMNNVGVNLLVLIPVTFPIISPVILLSTSSKAVKLIQATAPSAISL
jgi:hypothetical protein